MAGSLINRKTDILRAYYNEADKLNSDYDYIYPITLVENVVDTMDGQQQNLKTILQVLENKMNGEIVNKQDIVEAGELNNILAYSGVAGKINQLIRTDTIVPTMSEASDYKIPSERAVVRFNNDVINVTIENVRTDIEAKIAELVTSLESTNNNVATNRSDISQLQSEVLLNKNAIADNHTAITSINEQLTSVSGTVNGWASSVLNPAAKDSVYDVQKRVVELEKTALDATDFGDGYYTKAVSIGKAPVEGPAMFKRRSADESDKIMISNTHSSVKGEDDIITNTTVMSSDGSVKLKLNTIGGASTVDVTAAVTPEMHSQKVDANPEIEAGTATKVTFDSKGLVTGGTNLTPEDIPELSIDKVSGLQAALDLKAADVDVKAIEKAMETKADDTDIEAVNAEISTIRSDLETKVVANSAITPGTASKITYDAKGLVTGSEKLTVADLDGGVNVADISDFESTVAKYALAADLNSLGADTTAKLATKIDVPETELTPGTAMKVSYDKNGLITGSATVEADDIPELPIAKVEGLQDVLDSKMAIPETTLTTKTGTKVTVDENGLVTGFGTLEISDLPTIAMSNVTGLQSTLDKVNEDIAGKLSIPATKLTKLVGTKVTVDESGLVTKVEDVPATTMADVTGLTDAINGINSSIDSINTALESKLNKPETELTVTSGYKTTVDANGLVTALTGIDVADVPEIPQSKVTGLEAKFLETDTVIGGKVSKPSEALTTLTGVKATVTADGLVTGFGDLTADDIPEISTAKVTGLDTRLSDIDTALGKKVGKLLTPLTPGAATKISYNADGLVTGAASAQIDDIPGLQTALNDKVDKSAFTNNNYVDQVTVEAVESGSSDIFLKINVKETSVLEPTVQDTKLYQLLSSDRSIVVNDIRTTETGSNIDLKIANLPVSKITGLQDALDGKVAALTTAPTGTSGSKVTIDTSGLVTGVEALTADDIPELAMTKITGLTDAIAAKADASAMATKAEINALVLAYANAIKSGLEAASVDVSHIDFSTITPLA